MITEDTLAVAAPAPTRQRPALPAPTRTRWQPLRIGLVELFHYDSEEFWFHDGHLLLRGNNGTGKSKVLSLTLPFLLDASLVPTRVEPDADRTKRMEWNLLMGRHEKRVGYSWLEFGRREDGGAVHYLTLGCGMRAVAGRSHVESWFFITEQRLGEELFLITASRTALSRDLLGEALGSRGQIFETAKDYRRAVDERLFRLGDRYDGLIDTLIQLRQPQLSKKPDEAALSEALSNALPELSRPLLEDVADAMSQLDEYRDDLLQLERLQAAVARFGQRYRLYAQIQSRRQARIVRQAQTEVDGASRAHNEVKQLLAEARSVVGRHQQRCDQLESEERAARAVADELQADPTMADARRLGELVAQARDKGRDRQAAAQRHDQAAQNLALEVRLTETREYDLRLTQIDLDRAALDCGADAGGAGLAEAHAALVGPRLAGEAAGPRGLEPALLQLAQQRQAAVDQLERRHAACDDAERRRQEVMARRDLRREAHEGAEREARRVWQELEAAGKQLVDAWRDYLRRLEVLSIEDSDAGLEALAEWMESMSEPQPMRVRLEQAYRVAAGGLADDDSQVRWERSTTLAEDDVLRAEAERLEAGEQLEPPSVPWREREGRAACTGGPFWRMFELRDEVTPAVRAGIEAALEGAGLLDAWVTPDGVVLDPNTSDAWVHPGPDHEASLAGWLVPAPAAPVERGRLEALLASIACGETDAMDADTWVAPDGRFRVGRLVGAHRKSEAQYLGAAAREAARQRRLAFIAGRRAELTEAMRLLADRQARLEARRQRLAAEHAAAPSDDGLQRAQAKNAAAVQRHRGAAEELAAAEAELQDAERTLRAARQALEDDARDVGLPVERSALSAVESALASYRRTIRELVHALESRRRCQQELETQRRREILASEAVAQAARDLKERQAELEDVEARLELLRETSQVAVTALEQRLTSARKAVKASEVALASERDALVREGASVARYEQRAQDLGEQLAMHLEARRASVETFRDFARTGLLALALPDLSQPDGDGWTVDPVLSLARRAEQGLAGVAAEPQDWERVQHQISQDYTALGQELSGLGHKAQMEHGDHGLVVEIVYGNRAERPDVLEAVLAGELEQRRAVLSSREREVLENHLQAEVAASLQRLLSEAEARVARINAELEKRPTSTGVYFKLDWEALPEGTEGAPVGFAQARGRLLRRVADAWSLEDRRALGEFLQARIASERAADDTGTLVEHLARALDYRRWHRFRVKRWHDGAFRPLSGPASSGERALGLTVPLFAAASSHYASSGAPNAPRLVLLDEAFAGIDDEARAHCMALIAAFDLDFVMTSEREWGCYATLPGVSICQIIRREGVDAVFVSRWTWDGKARRQEPDPSRRYPDAID